MCALHQMLPSQMHSNVEHPKSERPLQLPHVPKANYFNMMKRKQDHDLLNEKCQNLTIHQMSRAFTFFSLFSFLRLPIIMAPTAADVPFSNIKKCCCLRQHPILKRSPPVEVIILTAERKPHRIFLPENSLNENEFELLKQLDYHHKPSVDANGQRFYELSDNAQKFLLDAAITICYISGELQKAKATFPARLVEWTFLQLQRLGIRPKFFVPTHSSGPPCSCLNCHQRRIQFQIFVSARSPPRSLPNVAA